jgi:hypothetical protein
MATTTTNFGWDIPQSTDLVKDGATAIAALGQDIDTAFVDFKGGTTGQVLKKTSGTDLDVEWGTASSGLTLINTTSFSGVSSVSAPANTFTATYDNYKIVAYIKGTVDTSGNFRFRSAGADNTTSNYWWGGYYQGYGATTTINPETGGGALNVGRICGISSLAGGFAADVFSPFLTDYSLVCAPSVDSYNRQYSNQFRATTSFDSFTIYPGTGTITGTMSVYGVNK